MTESSGEEEVCKFKWGKKRGIGGKNKEVQFYESFTYDGEDYSLFDNVYLFKEDEPEPYIGKLVKIWEQPPEKKKIKVLWFFRPEEILNWLGDATTLDNELFLASGDGTGLANINSVEAIAGKCHVVCTSKDSRNLQPSSEELRMADYIFYRTFDVGNCVLSEKLNDKIAGVEVRFLLNRQGGQISSGVHKIGEVRKENGNVLASNEVSQLSPSVSSPRTLENIRKDDMPSHVLKKQDEELKLSLPLPKQDGSLGGNIASGLGAERKDIGAPIIVKEHVSSHEKTLSRSTTTSCKDKVKTGASDLHILENKPSKKATIEHKKLKCNNDLGMLGDKPSKKARVDCSVELKKEPSVSISLALDKEKSGKILQLKQRVITDRNDGPQASEEAGSASEDKTESKKPLKDPTKLGMASLKKVRPEGKTSKSLNGTPSKATSVPASEENVVSDGQLMEVTRRPDTDRSKWFYELPFDERMPDAHKQGTLVLLENLDPTYSSKEIEDIVWSAFREHCTAKVVPHTSVSSPHSGQAFVIFKSRDAAGAAVRKLDEGCLMLPNGRPLVASMGTPPSLAEKRSTFIGHLVIDKTKSIMQREEHKQAVSTSHCSQPNTIEYDMAMEWCLLQTRSDSTWQDLYRQHGAELKKLQDTLKSK